MKKQKSLKLYCFSPPIMAITFVIEVVLAVLTLLRYKRTSIVYLIFITLIALGVFQMAEYFVCEGLGMSGRTWSRIGFIAITTLPALGLDIIYRAKKQSNRLPVLLAYAVMFAWIVLFGFSETAFRSHECTGNYVIFNLKENLGYLYSIYYYGILLSGIYAAFKFTKKASKNQQEILLAMIVGYLVFLLPTAIANTVNPDTVAGVPSIMCGFAVLFAFILYFYILPRAVKLKK